MFVEIQCPTCGNIGQVADAKVGKAVRCKECSEVFKASVRPATPESTPPDEPPQPPVRPAASIVPAPPATPASDEPPAFGDAVRLANNLYQAVHVLAALVCTVCIFMVIAGAANKLTGEAVVVVVVVGVQMFFAVLGAMLVLSLVRVFVGLARDVRAVRRKLCKERTA